MPSDADAAGRAQQLADAGAWAEAATLLRDHADDIRGNAACAALLGEALVRTGRASEARAWLVETLPGMARGDDRASLRRATVLSGAAHFELGDLAEARRLFYETLDLARADADDALVARAMNNLGAIDNIQGRWTEALANYNLAVSAHQRLGSARGLAECYHNMAITYRDLGDLEEADELEQRSVEFARASRQDWLVGVARLGRAELALRRGDLAGRRRHAAGDARLAEPAIPFAGGRAGYRRGFRSAASRTPVGC